jgi:hypothetical protein
LGEKRIRLGFSYNPFLPLPLGISPTVEVMKHMNPSISADEEEPQQDQNPTIATDGGGVVKLEVTFGIAPQLRLDSAGEY